MKSKTLRIAFCAALVLVTGCADVASYKGPRTNQAATVEYSADGIKKHGAYPNDIVWLMLYRAGTDKQFYAVKLTVDNPAGKVVLDAGETYTARLTSYEAQFGGYTNCVAETDISPREGEGYDIAYATQKYSCTVTATVRRVGSQQYDFVAMHAGSVGGQQFKATVTTVAPRH